MEKNEVKVVGQKNSKNVKKNTKKSKPCFVKKKWDTKVKYPDITLLFIVTIIIIIIIIIIKKKWNPKWTNKMQTIRLKRFQESQLKKKRANKKWVNKNADSFGQGGSKWN